MQLSHSWCHVHGRVAKDQGQDAPQRAALFGAVPMLRPEDLLGQRCNSPIATERRLRRAVKRRRDRAPDEQKVDDVDDRSRPVLFETGVRASKAQSLSLHQGRERTAHVLQWWEPT